MGSKRKAKNKPVWWPSISRPRAHEVTRLALQVLAWVPAAHDDTRRLTRETGPLTLETRGWPDSRLMREGHTPGSSIACEHRRAGTTERKDWLAPARTLPTASRHRSISSCLVLSSVQCSLVSTIRPSIPTDPVLPRRAPRQVNQTKSA